MFTFIINVLICMFGFVITSKFFIIRKSALIDQFIASINLFIAVFVIIASVSFIRYLIVCYLILKDFILLGLSLVIVLRDL